VGSITQSNGKGKERKGKERKGKETDLKATDILFDRPTAKRANLD
jgi:hypothetical protein